MWPFVVSVTISGLLAGVMYALVALGFVLIFKASGVFNFAQGAMVLFSALTFVGLIEHGMPVWLAALATIAVMLVFAYLVELAVLRHLIQQSPIMLFMATLGISVFLDGFGQALWGSNVHPLDIGIPQRPMFVHGVLINQFDLVAAAVGGALVVALLLFFHFTRTGRAVRAVADDNQAAQSVGIPLSRVWIVIWSVAGIVAFVAGIMWGSRLGVQVSVELVALKALPVLMLGGFTSIPGAIIGGLVIGVGEKLSEVFIGPHVGGGIEDWFAYMLAMLFLLVRPQGLFGERIIERV